MKQKTIQIQIKKEYHDLVPRPTKEDYATLKNSIKEDGQHLPITVNQDGVILDGHTRFQACRELKIEPKYEVKKFDNEFDEKRFVIITNLSRRHLTVFAKAEIAFNWFAAERATKYHRAGVHTWLTRRGKRYKKQPRLLNRFAKLIGTNATNAHQAVWLIENANERSKRRLRRGTMKIQSAYKLIKKPIWAFNRKNYKYDYYRYRKCPNCKAKAVKAELTGCHVHTKQCCTKCGWGT